MFDLLQFQPHLNGIPGAIGARYKFENGWEISVVAGPPNCGLYGNINENTYEVGIFRPNGNLTEDVSGWNTKEEVSAMMWVLSQL
jgi:surface protein